jgi:hypothetical protein
MARIKWLQHPTDPTLNGTEEHVSRSTADVLVAMRQASFSPYKNYVDRLSSIAREGSDPSNVNPPQVAGIEWSCTALPKSGKPVIWRLQGGERARLETEADAIAYGVPESVLKTFRNLTAVLTGAVNAAAAARPEQVKQEAAEKLGMLATVYTSRA